MAWEKLDTGEWSEWKKLEGTCIVSGGVSWAVDNIP